MVGYRTHLDVVHKEFDGTFCWFHARPGAIPGAGGNGNPAVVITMQKWFLSASDYFSGLSVLRTDDMGTTWQGPTTPPELGWREEEGGVTVGVCDFTPGWHPRSGKLLAIGHTVRYVDGHLMGEPRPRATGYSVYDPDSRDWLPWKEVAMPDGDKFFSAGAGCAQWLAEAEGTLLIPFYFKGKSKNARACATTTVMRCTFDGETIRYIEHGDELRHDVPRGFGEPSIVFYDGGYYLTIRNDQKGYVTRGDDGLHFAQPKPWTFDDGAELGSYNTQQHWVAHEKGLFLVYTRKGADNDHIVRNRAPLFIAQVDPERLCVMRETERVLIPERGAMMGNFGAAAISEDESWVTVGEGMYGEAAERGAEGAVFAARIQWERPNGLAGYLP